MTFLFQSQADSFSSRVGDFIAFDSRRIKASNFKFHLSESVPKDTSSTAGLEMVSTEVNMHFYKCLFFTVTSSRGEADFDMSSRLS